MATIQGPARHEFWKKEPADPFCGASIRLNEYKSKNRFEDILSPLQFIDKEPPDYIDKFHRIRDLVDAWNDNMRNNFTPGWVNCLDESMMVWTNQWTCPGFMFVPRKPHPFGNE
jgi:Transposase IS4